MMESVVYWVWPHQTGALSPPNSPSPSIVHSSENGINGLGLRQDMPAGMVNRVRGTSDFLWMHFHDPVQIGVGGSLKNYPAHSFIVWTPGSPHHYGTLDNQWRHSWLHFTHPALIAALEVSGLEFNTPYSLPHAQVMDKAIEDIYGELTEPARPDHEILESYFRIWVRGTSRQLREANLQWQKEPTQGSPAAQRMRQLVTFIELNLPQKLTLQRLASEVNLSPSHLSAEFKTHLGTSPIAYLLSRRLQQSLYLLRDHNLTIGHIAGQLGFDSPFYFSHLFKKHYGVSPSLYRQQHYGHRE